MSLTLGQLRDQLAAFTDMPDDTPVVLSKDAEGNGFSPLDEVDIAMYAGEAPDGAMTAVFLWPVN